MTPLKKTLLLFVLIGAITSAAAAPATAHSTSSETLFLTGADGSAMVQQTLVFNLDNETQQETFNNINESPQEYKNNYIQNLSNAADTEDDKQPNEFVQSRIATNVDEDSNQGTVQTRVIWKGFADTVTDDRIVVNDPLKDSYQTQTQTYLYPPRDYEITEESTYDDAERRDIALYWDSGTSFDNTNIVMEPANTDSTGTDQQSQTQSPTARQPASTTDSTPTTNNGLPGFTVVTGVLSAITGVLLYRHRQN